MLLHHHDARNERMLFVTLSGRAVHCICRTFPDQIGFSYSMLNTERMRSCSLVVSHLALSSVLCRALQGMLEMNAFRALDFLHQFGLEHQS